VGTGVVGGGTPKTIALIASALPVLGVSRRKAMK
jgi:hypothetical protein